MGNRIKAIIILSFLGAGLFYWPFKNAFGQNGQIQNGQIQKGQIQKGQIIDKKPLNSEQVAGLYTEATMIFRQAIELAGANPEKALTLYQRAVMRFERIIKDGGIENGKLYYNIGNAYFRMNDLGMAILNYLRAERLAPDDANLQHNLQYARSKRVDRIEEEQKIKVLKTLFFWHYDVPSGTRFVIFAIMSVCLWVTASLRLFYPKAFINRILISTTILLSLMIGSLAAEKLSIEKTQPGVIISPELTARKGNSKAYEPAFKEPLHAGTEFVLIEEREDWLHVELPDSRRCWVPKDGALLVENA